MKNKKKKNIMGEKVLQNEKKTEKKKKRNGKKEKIYKTNIRKDK